MLTYFMLKIRERCISVFFFIFILFNAKDKMGINISKFHIMLYLYAPNHHKSHLDTFLSTWQENPKESQNDHME